MQNIKPNNVELLAPAGSYESFIAAINAGADAVYMGLKSFNARTMSNNFTLEEYITAIDYAHKRDVKVYLTLNILVLDTEIKQAIEYVYELYKVGLDGVIVQDLGLAKLIHDLMPDLPLHASTQMSICTLEQVNVLEKLGFKRVVLARELSIEEIKQIANNTQLEIEVFVHGALCVSVSGQCLMSAMIGNRSANRGSCAGTCRKEYTLYNTSGKAIIKNKYLLSKKDIFGLNELDRLVNSGVNSLKIEGRNKTPEYVAGVVRSYKDVLISGYNKDRERDVLQLFNRSGKSDGYLNGVRYRQSISERSPKNVGMFLGKVIDKKNQYVKIKLEENINMHDGIETIGDNIVSKIVTCIRDDKFNIINSTVEKDNTVWIGDVYGITVGTDIYKTSDNNLNLSLSKYIKSNIKRLEYDVNVIIKDNMNIKANTSNLDVELNYIPENSKTSMVDEFKVKEAFCKTEETSVKLNVHCDIQEGLFVPTSKLNELRKELVKKLEDTKLIRKSILDFENKLKNELNIKKSIVKINLQIRLTLCMYIDIIKK